MNGIYEARGEVGRAPRINGSDDGPALAGYIVRPDSDGRFGGYIADMAADAIFVDWVLYYDSKRRYEGTEYLCLPWTIEAPGAAGECTGLLTADVTGGRW